MSASGGDIQFVLDFKLANRAATGVTRAGSNMVVAKYAKLLEGENIKVMASSPGAVDTSSTSEAPSQWIVRALS